MSISAKNNHVVIGLSGGVDSAVSALCLVEAGYEVSAITMQNWDSSDPYCTAEQDLSDAKAVCDRLGIPLHTVNFSKEYWDRVFQHCLDEFKAGRTPNPDVWCNREIKFDVFLEHALALGANALATGHYCAIGHSQDEYTLEIPKDTNKDQTYFLYMLNQHALKHTLFPLADLTKPDVRALAKKAGFANANKKDSTGICFIGERRFKPFLKEFLLAQPGEMQTDTGITVGKHDGVMFYTIGQRKGLAIGGLKQFDERPWYVIAKDTPNNILIVGQGEDHPALQKQLVTCIDCHWISNTPPVLPGRFLARSRYRQIPQACTVSPGENNSMNVAFDTPQRAITPGQSMVLYAGSACIGGGIIAE